MAQVEAEAWKASLVCNEYCLLACPKGGSSEPLETPPPLHTPLNCIITFLPYICVLILIVTLTIKLYCPGHGHTCTLITDVAFQSLPLITGKYVSNCDTYWKCYVQLLKIVTILTAVEVTISILSLLI